MDLDCTMDEGLPITTTIYYDTEALQRRMDVVGRRLTYIYENDSLVTQSVRAKTVNNIRTLTIHADHSGMCKFSDEKDGNHQKVAEVLERWAKELKKTLTSFLNDEIVIERRLGDVSLVIQNLIDHYESVSRTRLKWTLTASQHDSRSHVEELDKRLKQSFRLSIRRGPAYSIFRVPQNPSIPTQNMGGRRVDGGQEGDLEIGIIQWTPIRRV